MKRFAAVLIAALVLCSGCARDSSGDASSAGPSAAPVQGQGSAAGVPEESGSAVGDTAPIPEKEPSAPGEAASVPAEESPAASEGSAPAEAPADPFDDQEVIAADMEEAPAPESAPPESSSGASLPYVVYEDGRNRADIKEDMLEGIQEWQAVNSDTVGWLFVPHTTLDSPVLQSADNNTYYLTHNEWKQEDKNGALVSDYRNRFGGRENQSRNIVLYGHSKDENPDGGVEASREYEHFTELKRYQDIDFCRENPYVMFAAGGDPMVWEIFAVFHTRTDFYYIQPNPTDEEFREIVEEARYKSLFTFPDVEVGEGDKILTLSTCDRRIVPTYPNGYRFVIMAKLVDKGEPLLPAANVEENPTGLSPWNVF